MNRHVCAVLVTAALAGCGTGGGGGGGPGGPVSPPMSDSSSPPSSDSSSPPSSDSSGPPSSDSRSPPASFDLPTLSTVRDGVPVSSAITSRPHEHFRDRVSATADGAGNFTFTVNDPNVGAYTFTVNLPPNSSLNVSSEAIEGTFNSLLYSTAGVWTSKVDPFGFVAGAAAAGVATPRADLPTTGTAQYSGQFRGRQDSDGSNIGTVHAAAQSVANFGSGVVSFTTTNSSVNWGTGDIPDPGLDLTGSMTFQSSGGVRQNSLRGPVSTRHGMTGEVRGSFFGPASASSAPPELAGTVAVKHPGSAPDREGRSVIGGFVLKR
jgi:hypothetical protein